MQCFIRISAKHFVCAWRLWYQYPHHKFSCHYTISDWRFSHAGIDCCTYILRLEWNEFRRWGLLRIKVSSVDTSSHTHAFNKQQNVGFTWEHSTHLLLEKRSHDQITPSAHVRKSSLMSHGHWLWNSGESCTYGTVPASHRIFFLVSDVATNNQGGVFPAINNVRICGVNL